MCKIAPFVVAAASLATVASAQQLLSNDRRWRVLLRQQLVAEKACDLDEVLAFNQMKLGDEIAIEGRISCIDGREFNFSRKGLTQKFLIRLCEPSVC
jgi:hypothetical protein